MDTAVETSADLSVLRYRVDGMDCPSCAGKIETGLGRLAGAGEIRVNYQKQMLVLRLDETRTPRDAVEAKVRSLGFGISLAFDPLAAGVASTPGETDAEASARPWWQNGKIRWLLLVGVLLVAGYALDWAVPALEGWATLPGGGGGGWGGGPRGRARRRGHWLWRALDRRSASRC
jgi:Cd2+/Zn2+-exporting ATPase